MVDGTSGYIWGCKQPHIFSHHASHPSHICYIMGKLAEYDLSSAVGLENGYVAVCRIAPKRRRLVNVQ